jgi:hypothetical protein
MLLRLCVVALRLHDRRGPEVSQRGAAVRISGAVVFGDGGCLGLVSCLGSGDHVGVGGGGLGGEAAAACSEGGDAGSGSQGPLSRTGSTTFGSVTGVLHPFILPR